VIVERETHPLKQDSQIVFTEEGIQIAESAGQTSPRDIPSQRMISSTETTTPETEIKRRGNAELERLRYWQQARCPASR
jgi:hypothetical protein